MLNYPKLQLFIDGEWKSRNGQPVLNPADDSVLGTVPHATRADLDAAPDRDKLRAEIEERLNRYRSPFRTAETFLIEEIIDPRDTRPLLCEFAHLVSKLREPGPVTTPMRP